MANDKLPIFLKDDRLSELEFLITSLERRRDGLVKQLRDVNVQLNMLYTERKIIVAQGAANGRK